MNLTPPASLNPTIIATVVKAIGLALEDAADPTLSENAKDRRTDLALAAMRYYRAHCILDTCLRLLETHEAPENDTNMTMEALVGLLGMKTDKEVSKLRDAFLNLYEVFEHDKLK